MGDFAALLGAQLAAVRQFSGMDIKIEEPHRGCETADVDRFTVVLPCCHEELRWNVIYNADLPDVPPDFIFPPHDDYFNPLLTPGEGGAELQSLYKGWTLKDSQLLLRLLLVLRSLYVHSQLLLLEGVEDPRVHFEVTSLGKREGMEVYLVGGQQQTQEIQLSVPLLGLDFSPLADMIASHCGSRIDMDALDHPKLHLLLAFPVAGGGGVGKASRPQGLRLVGSTSVRVALALLEVELPPYTQSTYLADYVDLVERQLSSQILETEVAVGNRREFISTLAPTMGRPLDTDTVMFRRTTVFIIGSRDLVLVHFSLPAAFPAQAPTVVLQSAQHFDTAGRPVISRVLNGCPWSPRWESQEMVTRLCSYVAEESVVFRRLCAESMSRK